MEPTAETHSQSDAGKEALENEQEWLAVTNKLRSYIEHPEEHTAIVFLMGHLSPQTIERLEREKGLIASDKMGNITRISRIPGNPYDAMAKQPK